MSSLGFGVLILVFAVVWLFLAARSITHEIRESSRARWMMLAMGSLVMIGAAGFFVIGLSGAGILKTPSSFEWPAGYVKGIAGMADGTYIVPLVPPGRVQLYDHEWKFLRGWNVNASGGAFTVGCGPGDT